MLTTSIVIPTYNQNLYLLEAAILSAAVQILDWEEGSVEVVLVDDGSEESLESFFAGVVGRFDNQYFSRYAEGRRLEFKYVQHEENRGVAEALNSGIEQATGEYIQWLSSDDLLCQRRSQEQVAYMDREDMAISYCAYFDGIPQSGIVWPAIEYNDPVLFRQRLAEHCFINACSVIWHKSIFDEVGLFDPSYTHTQDYEYLLRCAKDWHFAPYNVPLLRRRTHAGQMSQLLKQPEEQEKKKEEMQRLHDTYGVTNKVYVPK